MAFARIGARIFLYTVYQRNMNPTLFSFIWITFDLKIFLRFLKIPEIPYFPSSQVQKALSPLKSLIIASLLLYLNVFTANLNVSSFFTYLVFLTFSDNETCKRTKELIKIA